MGETCRLHTEDEKMDIRFLLKNQNVNLLKDLTVSKRKIKWI
jgi:hypothetical protein